MTAVDTTAPTASSARGFLTRGSVWTRVGIWVLLLSGSVSQRWGQVTFDTKFDLSIDPGGFLERTLHLWNLQATYGELQNQAYGYLFPQGAFFLAGQEVGVSDWVLQRLWSGLILVVAFEGATRLFRANTGTQRGWRSEWLPMVAGLAFAFSPRLLGLSGVLTAEILPTAVLPWVVLPLIRAQQGRYRPWVGASLSGVALLFFGGVNAAENIAALPLPIIVLAFGLGTWAGRRLAAWWVVALVVASSWWVLPLLVLGKYSPPFLDYIETAAATTRPLGWGNVVRGADHWLAYIWVGGQPWWPGAYELATSPLLILATAAVAAVSLLGLFHRGMPGRGPFAVTALLGMALLTIAHAGAVGSPLASFVQQLLDGVLSPLRNVHKVDPLVRLPLALGFAHAVGLVVARARVPSQARARSAGYALVVVGLVTLLVASAAPLIQGTLRKPGWGAVPDAWFQAADYLADRAQGRRVIILPGAGFGQQTWGWTIDEPIQGLARSPWTARTQIPLTPGQTIRSMDSIEERIQDGLGSPALADFLARNGVSYVLVRRDLDLLATDAPTPARVDLALSRSPGLTRVASFGLSTEGLPPEIDILRVDRTADLVDAVALDSVKTIEGGPEDVLTALEAGLLGPGEATVNWAEENWPEIAQNGEGKSPDIVADGYRRRERQFGRQVDSVSQIMAADEKYRTERPATDYPGVEGAERVAASYAHISALSASSSAGYVDVLGPIRPEMGPYSAFDGVPETYWRSASLERPQGQWLQVDLDESIPISTVTVIAAVDRFTATPARRIRVDAGGESQVAVIDPATGRATVTFSGRSLSSLRFTVTRVAGDPSHGVVAIREINIPGVSPDRVLDVPSVGAGDNTAFVFRARPNRRGCVATAFGPSCDADSARVSEEENRLARSFALDTGGTWEISGQVVARQTRGAAELLAPIDGSASVVASSVLAQDPAVAGQYAFDDDPVTPWLSARGDPNPELTYTFSTAQTVSGIQVVDALSPSNHATTAIIRSGNHVRVVELRAGSIASFEPLTARQLTIRFPIERLASTAERPAGIPEPIEAVRPLGIGEVILRGAGSQTYSPRPDTRTGAVCGFGPELRIDGRLIRTRVTGSVSEVTGGTPLRLEPCGRGTIRLETGTHELVTQSTDRFAVTGLTLTPTIIRPDNSEIGSARTTDIGEWTAVRRTVEVGPGSRALLRVPENVNAGWLAVLDGEELTPIRIDGWQQGYLLPAGPGGTVTITFTPDQGYRLALMIGAIAAGLLTLLAGLGWVLDLRHGRVSGQAAVAVTRPRRLSRSAGRGPVLQLGLIALAYLIGGPALMVGVIAGLGLQRRARMRAWLGFGALLAAGLVASVWTHLDSTKQVFVVADVLAAIGVGLLSMALVDRVEEGRR